MDEAFTDAQAEEILRKLSDRWWRLNNLYWIHDKYGRKVLFKPNKVQADLDDNLHVLNVNFGKLTSMHFHSWKRGLKTGMYYLRTKAAADAIKFTVQKQAAETLEPMLVAAQNQTDMACSLDNPEGCEACGS